MRKYLSLAIVFLIGCTVSFTGCDEMQQMTKPVITDRETPVEPVGVLIYTGSSWWITPSDAAVEAETAKNRLQSEDIQVEITEDGEHVKNWMLQTTDDGSVNVLILYGVIPDTIYSAGNTQPDGSVAENWIETEDGNTILNHADYFGWTSQDDPSKIDVPPNEWSQTLVDVGTNKFGALRNFMDLPNIAINTARHNIPMVVTEDGTALTPNLVGFESDRPFPLDQLQGEWFAEKVMASDTGDSQATLADPVIVRDGDRGRLAIVHQTAWEDNPKGEVAAEIIINYLLNPNVELYVSTYVAFPDANLAKRVREALNLPAGADIPKSQLATLKVLEAWASEEAAPEEKIRDLTGLEHATELRELYLHYNQINDISLLAGLTQLTNLNIAVNEIHDMTPLVGLTNLTDLSLGSNGSRDISPLAGLTKLTQLDTWNNGVRDISPLAGLTKLTKLGLVSNQISDISALTGLTQLTELYLGNNQVRNISPLTRLTKLQQLWLGNNNIRNISPLRRLIQLKTLLLNSNEISDVSVLAGLVNLETLFLDENPITDITPLRTLLEKNPNVQIDIGETIWMPDPNLRAAVREALGLGPNAPITKQAMQTLTELVATTEEQVATETSGEPRASDNQITNLTGLEYATQLEQLYLGDNQIQDVSSLAGLTQLEQLYLGGNQIQDVSPLAGLTQLVRLGLERNQIRDISPLTRLTQLEHLYLGGNQIQDISPLAELTGLTKLGLTNSQIRDVSPLAGLTQLEQLYLALNQITDVRPLAGLVNLEILQLAGNPITDMSPLRTLLRQNPNIEIDIDVSTLP